MSKFTQGEWKYLQSPLVGLGGSEQWYLVGSPERAIGFIRHEEDIRLIAAAPKMYRLLKVLSSIDEPVNEERFDDLLLAVDEARKVLSRIDGEEAEE